MNKDIKEFREKFDELGKFLSVKYGTHIHYLPLRKLTEDFWLSKLAEKDQVIDKLIEDRPFDIKDALDAQKQTIKKEMFEEFLGSIAKEKATSFGLGYKEAEETILKKIDSWEYHYTNYMTQMDSKKKFDRGNLVRELAKELKEIIKKL